MKTIVGLYDDISDAHQTVRDLVDAGIPRDDISLVASDRNNEYSSHLETDTEAEEGAEMGNLILIKHAYPAFDPTKAPKDWPLSEEGREQAWRPGRARSTW